MKLSSLTTVTFRKLAKLHLRYFGLFLEDKKVQNTLTFEMEALSIGFNRLLRLAKGHGFLMCNILANKGHNLNLLQRILGSFYSIKNLSDVF